MIYYQLTVSETFKLLNTSSEGFYATEVEERKEKYRKNELTAKKKNSAFVLIGLFYVLLKINTNEKIIISNNIFLQKVTSVNL